MEIVIAVAANIAKYTVRPVGRRLCYSCQYKSNKECLKSQETTLRDAQKEVKRKVKTASDNGDEIKDNVKRWLKKVDDIIDQLAIKKLGGGEEEAELRNSNASCLNLKQRHQISREAKAMEDNIAELLKEKPKLDDGVSYRPAAQEMVTPRNVDDMTLDSRISITKRIMEALGDANINKIGVWGSPGVGKSTLMKEIFSKAKEESLFDEVALANVTDSPNLSRIQEEIANMLDLKLDPNCKTERVRAGHLRARLEKDKEKKILVILDDIWKRLDLEEIGITPSARCKVLLTSRDRQVLASEMVTEENSFKLDILGEQEAWNLFEKMAGDSVKDDHDLRNEAIKVAKACGGLPIALVTVSRALKNKNLRIWKDALVQLTSPTLEIPFLSRELYSCIQLSYECLFSRELKSLFLLCAQQGYYISYRDMLRYSFGLCLFHGIDTLEEARYILEILVRDLQDACLLLQSPHSSEEFYMNNVVRHVATIIASNDHNMFVMRGDGGQKAWPDVDSLKRCEALSIHGRDHIHKYPNKIECPKLRYFHVQCKDDQSLEIPNISFQGMDKLEDIFFQGMEKLKVLSLTNIQLSSLLPLTNLQTLCLDGCKLGDIHSIGELKTLVILSLARSDISNLPGEIGSLTGLQLLDLTNCFNLRVIPPNVLSSLVNLEELYMWNIDVQWEVEGPNNEGKNASLAELEKLSHLITLEIKIPDANNLPKDLSSEKLERYKICIGDIRDPFYKVEAAFSRSLHFKLSMSFELHFGIEMLLKRIEYLYLDESNSTKSVLYELDREDFQQLKHLHIQNNGNIMHLPELRTSFKNLKVLKVENCEKLRFIFSSSIARGLSLLEELNITRCNNVGAIFVKEEEDHGIEEAEDMMLFRQLQTLVLMDLPKLVSFLSTRETNSQGNHDLQLPLLHHQLSLPSLKKLHLQHLPKIKQIWSNVNGCESLKSLEIEDCGVLEEIVQREDGTDPTTRPLFPSLNLLKLHGLPKLKWFFQGVRTLESSSSKELDEQGGTLFGIEKGELPSTSFQKLRVLELENCEKLRFFFSSSIARGLSLLEKLEIKRCNNMGAIVVKEEKNGIEDGDVILFHHLQTLVLEDLPELVSFLSTRSSFMTDCGQIIAEGNRDLHMPLLHHQVSFPSLQTLRMKSLPKIKHVWSCGQEPETVFRCLEQLKLLWIGNCGVLEEIVAGGGGGEPVARTILVFPRVSDLKLKNLKRLKWFYKGVHISKWPMLEKIWISGCEKVKIFASGVVSFEETVEERRSEMSIEQPLFLVDELSFSSLKKLVILNMDKLEIIWQDQVAVSSFSKNIQDVEIDGCEKLLHVFQSNFRTTTILMQSLTRLCIWECRSLETIFRNMEGHNGKEPHVLIAPSSGTEKSVAREDGTARHIEFPILTEMSLGGLPKLKWILEGVHTNLECPSLEKLELSECDQVIWASKFASSSSSQETSQQNQLQTCIQLPLPNLLELEVWYSGREEIFPYELVDPVPLLRRLQLYRLPMLTHLWKEDSTQPCPLFHNLESLLLFRCDKLKNIVPSSTFLPNLTELDISCCDGLINLFTSSTAKTLVQLQKMTLTKCERITEIVAVEDGEANVAINFNKLAYLKLEDLPNLTHFCSRPFGFPSLDKVIVTRCPGMKTSTPELEFEFALEEAESRKSNVSCLNLKQRHQISQEAKEMADNSAKLLKEKPNLVDGVSYRPVAQEIVTPRNVDYMTFDSRISITERIMEALGDSNINKIGVWGSPGVGKSTLMKDILRKAKEESLFDEVAMANMTDSPNLSRIQGEIADMLGIKLDPNITEIGRKADLRARLEKDKEKKILVILDDIWKRLDLEEIGIIPSERCKVLLTSRDRHVLSSEMGTKENSFKLNTLGEEEAWNLFEKMVGDSVKDDHVLRNEAIKVAKECGGLPIALVTVSRALKNHKNLEIWKAALVQLTRIWSPVYSCIELSYKHLVSRELKSLFLLCARQGYYISYRDLLRYGFGLCLFHGIDTLEEARNRLETLVRDLQDACLLLQSPRSCEEFYMHDLVRHVATIIASNDHNMFVMRSDGGQKAWPDVDSLKRCEALAIHGGDHIHKYPNKIECPKLRYFHVQCDDSDDEDQSLEIPNISFQGMDKLEDIFFQGMEKLEVLSLTNIQLSSLFPLTNLQTLCLHGCKLGDIHWIGELKTLVILSLARSDISNLPGEIGSLTGLRLLDLSNCYKLGVISPNVLSSLVNLEELYMRNINVQWEVEGPNNEGKNASLAELKHLSHLITLEIDIENANNLPKDLFSEKLERYRICIGDIWDLYYSFYSHDFQLPLLHHQGKLPSTSFKKLRVLELENCEKLRFVFSSVIARGLSLLEELEIKRCNNMGAIVLKEEKDRIEDGDVILFHQLQTLVLKDLPELVSFLITKSSFMTDSVQIIAEDNHDLHMPLLHHQVSFPSLQTLRMKGLPKIKHVWSYGQEPKTVFRCLEQLKILEIEDCGVEEIVAGERGGGEQVARKILEFPRVTHLRLKNLKRLKWFYKGVHVTKWPMLEMISIEGCEKVEIFASGVVSFEETVKERSSKMSIKQPLFLVDELSFSSLKKLVILNMDKLEIIGQGQVAVSSFLKNIQDMEISQCEKLLHVFQSNFHTTTILTQCLTRLCIWDCSSLETIFRNMEGHHGKEPQVLIAPSSGMEESVAREDGTARHNVFPILTEMRLARLPKLKWILEGVHTNLECPSLEILRLSKCEQVIWASKFASSSSSQETSQQNQLQTCIQLPLPNLLELEVWISGQEEIFPYELVDLVPRLRRLVLHHLPMLTHLWKEDSTQPCPLFHNLEFLHLSRCGKLKNIVPSSVFLQNLTELHISYCDGLINLLTCSTAKTLMQLKKMTVMECTRITEIVAMEDGEANVAITFNKLAYLQLDGLPNLTHFCSGPYSFGFPSLDKVNVRSCPKMKTFCHGVSSTPA